MQDDPLSTKDQTAFDALPRAIEPPLHLEARAVAALREAGLLRPRRRFTAALSVAAALVVFVGGFALGRVTLAGSSTPAGPRYLLLLYGGASATTEVEAARVAEYGAWARELSAAGRLLGAEKLADSSRVLGDAGAAPSAAGEPSGFFLIRASTMDEAQAAASRCPHLKHGGTVVVRPIEDTGR